MNTELASLFYEVSKGRMGNLSIEDWINGTLEWEFVPLVENNKILSIIMKKDNVLHFCIVEPPKGISKSIYSFWKSEINKVVDSYGEAISYITKGYVKGDKFPKLLGYTTKEDLGSAIKYCIKENHVWPT